MTSRAAVLVTGLLLISAACGQTGRSEEVVVAAEPTTGGTPAEIDITAAPTTTTVATTTTTAPLRSFTMAFTGDFLLHNRVNSVAAANAAGHPTRDYDYRPMLEPIRRWVAAADWAVCHMEVNLSADGSRLSPYPAFRAPGQIAFDAKDLGYDSCSLASNHILDHGLAGVAETLGVFDEAGLHATGAARSAEEASAQRLFDVRGVRVAHLSYSYWFNGLRLPAEAPWTSNPIDEEQILADSAEVHRRGAEYVVVSLHWGEQYSNRPNRQQRELGSRLLTSDDIDLIVGHHAHVVQPITQIDGKWLLYGLGNLLSNSSQRVRRDELLVTATVTERNDGTFTTALDVVPLYLDHANLTVYPTSPTLRPADLDPHLAAELEASWSRVQTLLTEDMPIGLTVS